MEKATIVVLVALLQYFWFTAKVGQARGKYKIKAPACSGHEQFERLFRIQQNTMEQLVVGIRFYRVDDSVDVVLERSGDEQTISVTLLERPEDV